MNLEKFRKKIDKIDYQIHNLLNQRAQFALEIGKIKSQEEASFYRPEREREVLETMAEYNKGPLSDEAIACIFKMIVKKCRELQIETYKENNKQ